MGGFVTALFKNSALPLIALLIFATGANTPLRLLGIVGAKAGALLAAKTFIPGLLVILYGFAVGRAEILPGLGLLALISGTINSNGGLWIALASKYGNQSDVGAYIASALNDGPFFAMLFLGLSGLAQIPVQYIVAAILPYLLGLVLGNLDPKIGEIFKPTSNITIPFFAFSLGAGIDIMTLGSAASGGLIIGMLSLSTGLLGYLFYRALFKRDTNPGVGAAIGTTAGNAAAVPTMIAEADPTFKPFVASASAAVGFAVLFTAIFAPILTHYLASYHNKKNARSNK
ncbi:MAG: 2-keto-3-deoxygluconate permease [Thermosphaera sp.]